jgi:hypothetical protein
MTDHDDYEDDTPRDSERKGEVAQQRVALDESSNSLHEI